MKDNLADYLKEQAPDFSGMDYRDLQKAALAEVIKLSKEKCVDVIDQIEQAKESSESEVKREFEEATKEQKTKYDQLVNKYENEYKQKLQEITDKFDSDITRLEDYIAEEKAEAEAKAKLKIKDVQAGNEYEQLSADTAYEAVLKRCSQDKRETDEAMPKAKEHVHEQQEYAQWIMKRYHITPDKIAVLEPENNAVKNPDKEFKVVLDRAKENIAWLGNISGCKIASGVVPYMIVLLVCGAAVAGAWFVCESQGQALPPFKIAGVVAGFGAIVVSLAGIFLFWRSGKVKAVKLYQGIMQDLSASLVILEIRYSKAMAELKKAKEEAKAELESKKSELKQNLEQAVAQAKAKVNSTYEKLDAESGKKLLELKQKRQEQLEELEDDNKQKCERIKKDFELNTASARKRFVEQESEYTERYENDFELLMQRWREGAAVIRAAVSQVESLNNELKINWNDESWNNWQSGANHDKIRVGEFLVDTTIIEPKALEAGPLELPDQLNMSAALTFPDKCSMLLQAKRDGREDAIDILKAAVLRLFTSLPAGRVHFTIVDPVGLGENFAGFMHAADYEEALIGGRIWTSPSHIKSQLEDLTAHMENVIQKYLRNEFSTIEQYNKQAGELAEPYRFLVIADFPQNFNEESVKHLKSIINSGPRCGVYTLIAFDSRQPLPDGIDLDDLKANSTWLKYEDGTFVWQDSILSQFPLSLDMPPAESVITDIMHKVGKAGQDSLRVEVPFDCVVPEDGNYWSQDNGRELVIPIGRTGATRLQYLKLGRGVSQHILIAGKTGSGKSTLLHVIIAAMSSWYSPEQVELYLIDFKKGVEFKAYAEKQLPHARVVAIESDREFGLSVLQKLDNEMTRRGNDFRNAGVQDIAGYREATGIKLPRAILIVDEFQIFFSEDDQISQNAALLLEQLVRQGRAFGIHVILGSQTLGGPASLARSTIGQMAVRIAMQCSEADSQLILDDDNTAARLLNRPGEAIYNDAGGMVTGNSPFQTAWISELVRDNNIDKVVSQAAKDNYQPPKMIVFEGNAPAHIVDNKLLVDFISGQTQADIHSPVAWLGEPVSIKSPTAVTFQRQSGTNLLITGQRDDAALGIAAAAIKSLAAQNKDARYIILDGSPAGSATEGKLTALAEELGIDYIDVPLKAVEETFAALSEELQERTENDVVDAPPVFIMIYGLHRYRVLRKGEDDFSFSMDAEEKPKPDKMFAELLREGPVFGIHTIVWVDTLSSLERACDRATVREFDNRVLFQMSLTDSSNLIDSPAANQLGFHRALFYSEEQGVLEKFRPYAL